MHVSQGLNENIKHTQLSYHVDYIYIYIYIYTYIYTYIYIHIYISIWDVANDRFLAYNDSGHLKATLFLPCSA